MSIKSNIEILKSWLSEKVKVSYEQKDKLILQNLEVNTKQAVLVKWNSKNEKIKQ